MYKLDLEKAEEDQIGDIFWIIEKVSKFPQNICFIDYLKTFDCVDQKKKKKKTWKILKQIVIPDHLACLLRILYAGQEATVKSGHGTTDHFKIGKGMCQGCILSL